MTPIIRLSSIITQKLHRVILGKVLGILADKLLDSIPQRRDRLDVFVE